MQISKYYTARDAHNDSQKSLKERKQRQFEQAKLLINSVTLNRQKLQKLVSILAVVALLTSHTVYV